MSVTNFKLIAQTLISDHLAKIESGEIHLNVSNQHDYYVCESALDVLSNDEYNEDVKRVVILFQNADMSKVGPMSLAFSLSKFQPEALDSAWID